MKKYFDVSFVFEESNEGYIFSIVRADEALFFTTDVVRGFIMSGSFLWCRLKSICKRDGL